MSQYHHRRVACTDYRCRHRGAEGYVDDIGLIPFGPITGCSALAAELMRHYEVDPTKYPDALFELEQAIAEAMLDTGCDILREHGIAYPGFDPAAVAVS